MAVFHSENTQPYGRWITWLVVGLGALILGVWLAATPPGLLGKADAVGYAICHRIDARSFHVHDRPLPLCARCTGIYLGVMTGLAFVSATGRARASRLPPVRVLAVMGLLGALYGVDGLNSYLSMFAAYTPIYQPHNTLRLITGMTFGLALITVVLPVFNATIWREPVPTSPLHSLRELAALYGIAAGVTGLVLLKLPALLVIAGLVSTLGVVVMFVGVGTMLFVITLRREGSMSHWRDLALPLAAGLVFAITIVGGIDAVRYWFTGTWDGFILGG
jgi:uncharacterized membrane protein